MNKALFDRLFVFEMANNHMGDLDHGLRIINAVHRQAAGFDFTFAFKFQYRDLDTFIHPAYRERRDIKYVKRFQETRLEEADFRRLRRELGELGMLAVCTPFDEISVDRVVAHDYDAIKIASCSFTDWPLLERIAATDKPIIASTAGATLDDIDKVVAFFGHREKELCLMHCVGSYPTPEAELELNQIRFLRERYASIPIGYSTHEAPDNTAAIKMAIAAGACVFERHVGLNAGDYRLNAYSSTPEQVRAWLAAAAQAYAMAGVDGRRRDLAAKEQADLRGLKRGVFCRRAVRRGERISPNTIFYAIPCQPGQLLANDCSKYISLTATRDLQPEEPVLREDVALENQRDRVLAIVRSVCALIKTSGVQLGDKLPMELSHHYGLTRFSEWGCTIINCINREYCKKIILLLPGQKNPTHTHRRKEETFHLLHGDLSITLNGVETRRRAGDIIVVERGVPHSFSSENGAALEEISTTHYRDDSFYDDTTIADASWRKTYMTFRSDWLSKDIT